MHFEALPSPLPGMRAWGVDVGKYHFVITYEDGRYLREEDRAEWKGYIASFKSFAGRNAQAVRIDGKWSKFTEAEAACQETWRKLRANN